MEAYDQARQALGGLTGSEQALPRSKKTTRSSGLCAKNSGSELIGLTTDLRGRASIARNAARHFGSVKPTARYYQMSRDLPKSCSPYGVRCQRS